MQSSPLRFFNPAPLPRSISRRGEPRPYPIERISIQESRARHAHRAPASVDALADAGRTGSALRRRLKERGIDPKLARLVLLYYGRSSLRAAEVAWALSVSPSTASRWLDRAERAGLVDKQYLALDRRGTWSRLTDKGIDLRRRVEGALVTLPTNERPRGIAWGIRATRGWDD
jgi:DNA-binding MarR family transcriptional regulator